MQKIKNPPLPSLKKGEKATLLISENPKRSTHETGKLKVSLSVRIFRPHSTLTHLPLWDILGSLWILPGVGVILWNSKKTLAHIYKEINTRIFRQTKWGVYSSNYQTFQESNI